MKLNLGSGPTHFDGFLNVDYDPSEGPDVLSEVDALPFEDGAADEILASHILEHVPFWSNAVQEWARVLAPGGICWVMVPDIMHIYEAAVQGGVTYLQAGEWKPVSYDYVNAAVFGGIVLGPPWNSPGHIHRQIFLGDMLERQLAPFFSTLERTKECPHREIGDLEICVKAVK